MYYRHDQSALFPQQLAMRLKTMNCLHCPLPPQWVNKDSVEKIFLIARVSTLEKVLLLCLDNGYLQAMVASLHRFRIALCDQRMVSFHNLLSFLKEYVTSCFQIVMRSWPRDSLDMVSLYVSVVWRVVRLACNCIFVLVGRISIAGQVCMRQTIGYHYALEYGKLLTPLIRHFIYWKRHVTEVHWLKILCSHNCSLFIFLLGGE